MMLLLKLFLIIIPLFNFTKAGDGDQIQYDGTSSIRNQPSGYTMANSLPVSRNVQVDFPCRTGACSSEKTTPSAATEPDSPSSTTKKVSPTSSDTQMSTRTPAPPTPTASIVTAARNDSSSTATPASIAPDTYSTTPPYPQQLFPSPYLAPYPAAYPYQPQYYLPPYYYPSYPPFYPYPPMNYTPPYYTQTTPTAPTPPPNDSTSTSSTTPTVASTDGSPAPTASTEAPSSTMSINDTSPPTSTTPANNGSTSTSTATPVPPGVSSTEPTSSTPANNDSKISTSATPPPSTTATPPARVTSQPESTPSETEKPTSDCGKTPSFNSVPNECDTYVECKDGVSKKHYCPDGLVFKPSTKWHDFPCVAPSEYKCSNGSFKQKTVATELCPHRNGYFLKKDSDCSQYVVCTAGKPTIMHCAEGLVFSVEQGACDWPANVPSCKAEAFKDFECPAVEADDSDTDEIFKYSYKKNCRKYIACQGGYPRLLSCDSGLYFSEEEEMCVDKSKVTDCVEE